MTLPLDDAELEARRAMIDVHCGGCGASFPGDTKLNNGLCRECCRSPIHLIRKVERYRKALEKIRGVALVGQSSDPSPAMDFVVDTVNEALEDRDA